MFILCNGYIAHCVYIVKHQQLFQILKIKLWYIKIYSIAKMLLSMSVKYFILFFSKTNMCARINRQK